jgi:spore germination protein YaaH
VQAQGNKAGFIQNRVQSKSRRLVEEKVSALKSTGRRGAVGTKRALKSSLKGARYEPSENLDPTLDELIEDPEKRASLTNSNNDGRYIELLGEWTTMPSDAELKLRAEIQAFEDSLRNIDRKLLRQTRNIWDDSRPMVIFGWHPYWMGNLYKGYDYGMYNVVSYYSYDINPDQGGPQNPQVINEFLASDFVQTAQGQGCSALLSITCHGEQNVRRFLNNNNIAQRRLLDSLVFILDSTNADGIEINFEGVNTELKNDFNRFVRTLSTTITAARGDTSFVFLSVPPYDPNNVYDIALLQNFVDIFVVKGFDMHETPKGLAKQPSAPLNYSRLTTTPDIRKAVDKYIANLGPLYSARLVLALPYSGTLWYTDGVTEEVLDMRSVTFSDVQFEFVMQMNNFDRFPGARLRYDSMMTYHAFSYYDYYNVDTLAGDIPVDVTLYFDDTTSLRKKYDYIIDSRLGGVGVQFLGNDAGFYRLEQVLSNAFMEEIEPVNTKLAELNSKSNMMRENAIYLLAVLLYLAIFMSIGFCAALFNVKVRQALFQEGRFRVLFMIFITILILLLGGYMGLFRGTTLPLMVGVVFGAFMSWLGWKYFSRRKSLTP